LNARRKQRVLEATDVTDCPVCGKKIWPKQPILPHYDTRLYAHLDCIRTQQRDRRRRGLPPHGRESE
jgi:hypothetical protein